MEHKETLKAMRTDVDVLAMSATPIPRTLEMAVTGIREMSTLATPPEERHPILTYVGPHENPQVAAAIRRELMRDGQVFYIHNSVKTITSAARRLSELVPEARIAVAHGQMSEKQARTGHRRLLREALRRPGVHDHRRDGTRHLQRQHPHRREGQHVRPQPGFTSCAAAWGVDASVPTPTSCTPRTAP
ncbi:hypothetical protein GCM10025876_12060 [Demequina litorisediminis]|uniref:Uncharacterized protein n=1 Tax=Demequina litorisediminis TaxID=1849022 RepID=A0ABQ6IDC4_9MICO|nr:hypothetical protein GCM10025876_12060 [Demequina litorisediminis]